jgi:hypothetical protein
MTTRKVDRVLEHPTVVAVLIKPVAAQTCCVAVQDNTGMLGRPIRRVAAVLGLIRMAQRLAPSPQPRRVVHQAWHHLPVDDETDVVGGCRASEYGPHVAAAYHGARVRGTIP